MHKLAIEMNEIDDGTGSERAASLVMRSDEGKRSYKVAVAPPEGLSYAKDIAEKVDCFLIFTYSATVLPHLV